MSDFSRLRPFYIYIYIYIYININIIKHVLGNIKSTIAGHIYVPIYRRKNNDRVKKKK